VMKGKGGTRVGGRKHVHETHHQWEGERYSMGLKKRTGSCPRKPEERITRSAKASYVLLRSHGKSGLEKRPQIGEGKVRIQTRRRSSRTGRFRITDSSEFIERETKRNRQGGGEKRKRTSRWPASVFEESKEKCSTAEKDMKGQTKNTSMEEGKSGGGVTPLITIP